MTTFSFDAIIASRGYHVYKDTTWPNAEVGEQVKVELETNPKSIAVDPYSCSITAEHSYFIGWKTVGHIPREISRYVYFFIKKEGKVYGTLKSLKYKASPIPSGGLEVPPMLTFECNDKWVSDTMNEFVKKNYSYEFGGHLVEVDDIDNESDVETIDVAADEEPENEEPGGSSENNGEVSNHLVDNSPSVEKDITIVVIDD